MEKISPLQELVTQLAAERLDVAVLPRRAGLDERSLDAELGEPLAHRRGDELRARCPDVLGNAVLEEELRARLEHVVARDPALDENREAFPRVLIFVAMFLVVPGMFFAGAEIHNESERVRAIGQLEVRLAELLKLQRDGVNLRESEDVLAVTGLKLRSTDSQQAAELLPADANRLLSEEGSASGAMTSNGQYCLFAAETDGPWTHLLLRPYVDRLETNQGGREAAIEGTLGLALALAIVIAWIASRWVTRPIAHVIEASGRLADAEEPGLLPAAEPSELRRLTLSFNEMSRRLSTAREAERAFLSSSSTSCARHSAQ